MGPGDEPLVPPGPQPPDPTTADAGGPVGGDVPASEGVEPVTERPLVPPSASPAPGAGLPVTRSVPPAGPSPSEASAAPRMHWALILVGIPIGFVAWVVGSILLLNLWRSSSGIGSTGALAVLVVLLVAAVGLIVWRRTRRLAQGFVLGLAIGLVVAGGLCIPLVSSIGF